MATDLNPSHPKLEVIKYYEDEMLEDGQHWNGKTLVQEDNEKVLLPHFPVYSCHVFQSSIIHFVYIPYFPLINKGADTLCGESILLPIPYQVLS